MRLQRMLGHITTLVPKNPSKVLVIGCGAGVTAGAVSIDPMVKDQTIAEIEPLVPQVVSTLLRRAQLRRRQQPEGEGAPRRRAALPADDGREVRRHHVGPARPVGQGRGDALHARVLRGGQGAPQPGRRRHAVRAALREQRGGGEERDRRRSSRRSRTARCSPTRSTARATTWCCSASSEDGKIDVDAVQARLDDPANAPIAQSLREIGINSAVDLFGTYAGRTSDMKAVAERRA